MGELNFQIDSMDRGIISRLQKDARKPYLEIARELKVSGGTIHQRVDRLKELGIIRGSKVVLDHKFLGYDVSVMVGIHLNLAGDCKRVIKTITGFPEVTEAHYTTGGYALMIRVVTKTMDDYYHFLMDRLQSVQGVRSTESFICMSTPINRDVQL